MLYFFLVLTLISLAVIIFILSKKFPVLAVLNVENIPGEKEASFKKEICLLIKICQFTIHKKGCGVQI
jgi:hypothetical protein